MKKLLHVLMITLLGSLLCSNVMGQVNTSPQLLSLGMPEISLLSSVTGTINLQLTTATAGLAVKSKVADSTARVRISSVITSATRTLSASVTSVPAGTYLKLMAQPTLGTVFGGTPGILGAEAQLSAVDSPIITGIGSCYSGVLANDGYVLRYTWGLDNPASNYGAVRATGAGTTVTVTLTLTAAI